MTFSRKKPKKDDVLYQLKQMFQAIHPENKPLHLTGFCHAYKDFDGNPTNPGDTIDSEEFFNILIDRLDSRVQGTEYKDIIKIHFGGILIHELISKTCPHHWEREEQFFSLGLEIQNNKTIEECFAKLVTGEIIENYNCNHCNKQVDVFKRTSPKKLPNHLMLFLKRVAFDFDTFTNKFLNDYLELPKKLDINPYSCQSLHKADQQEKNGTTEESKGETDLAKEHFQFTLAGTVIYSGTGTYGYYYSLIQDRETSDDWYKFNTTVNKFDPKDIPAEAFGANTSFGSKLNCASAVIYDRITQSTSEVKKDD